MLKLIGAQLKAIRFADGQAAADATRASR